MPAQMIQNPNDIAPLATFNMKYLQQCKVIWLLHKLNVLPLTDFGGNFFIHKGSLYRWVET